VGRDRSAALTAAAPSWGGFVGVGAVAGPVCVRVEGVVVCTGTPGRVGQLPRDALRDLGVGRLSSGRRWSLSSMSPAAAPSTSGCSALMCRGDAVGIPTDGGRPGIGAPRRSPAPRYPRERLRLAPLASGTTRRRTLAPRASSSSSIAAEARTTVPGPYVVRLNAPAQLPPPRHVPVRPEGKTERPPQVQLPRGSAQAGLPQMMSTRSGGNGR